MFTYILRRLGAMIPLLFFISIAVFALMSMAPGTRWMKCACGAM